MTGKSLVRASDQMVEACHQYMDKMLRRSGYWVKDPISERCGRKLLAGTLHFNGYNASRMGMVTLVRVASVQTVPAYVNLLIE